MPTFTETVRTISYKKIITGIVVLIIAITGVRMMGARDAVVEEPAQMHRQVSVVSVAELAKERTPLPLLGTVTSKSEAVVRAEASGKLVIVHKKLGDYITSGEVIAEFDNASQKAQLTQAEGAYESALAAREIAGISSGSANETLAQQKTAALNAIASAQSTMDDVVHTKTDPMWNNPRERDPRLLFQLSDDRLRISLESIRVELEPLLEAQTPVGSALYDLVEINDRLSKAEADAKRIKTYIDDLALALARALPDANVSQATIDGWKATVGAARTTIAGTIDTLSGTRTKLTQAASAAEIAAKQGSGSGSSSADAALKSALGNLEVARAGLEKTIVRSPISGTINSLSVETGDIVSPFSEIAVVSNNGALEVVAYVTEEEKHNLTPGGKVTIGSGISGVITRVAPAIDPATKKIELRIGIVGSASSLTNGQSVPVYVLRRERTTGGNAQLTIPLQAIKLTPGGSYVFTVKEDSNALEAHTVKTGAIQGEYITVTEGISPDMKIVTDARGLKDGTVVEIAP